MAQYLALWIMASWHTYLVPNAALAPVRLCARQGHAAVAEFFGYVGLLCTLALAPLVGLLALAGVYSLDDVPRSALWIILLEGGVGMGVGQAGEAAQLQGSGALRLPRAPHAACGRWRAPRALPPKPA